jgi:hypothetical protein
MVFWYRGVHSGRHDTYGRKAENTAYSFDEVTDAVSLHGEAQHNSAATVLLYAERCPQ